MFERPQMQNAKGLGTTSQPPLVAHRELKTNLRIRVVFDLLAEGIG